MQLSGTILNTLLLASSTLALPSATTNSTLTLNPILPRDSTNMKGSCTKDSNCQAVGTLLHKKYPCYNSHCGLGDEGKFCQIAGPAEDGQYKGKCPVNDPSYEWDWPWLDCTKKENEDKGTCARPDCGIKEAKDFWNCKNH
jgi:hypothetical protein